MILVTLLVLLSSGLAIARLLDLRRSLGWELAASLLAGVIQIGALTLAALLLHLSPRAFVLVGALLSLGIRVWIDSRRGDGPRRSSSAFDRRILFGAIALTLLVLLPALTREWIRVRSDAWYHAAIVEEINHHGLLPQDPYFAGLRLQYMWFFHCVVIGLRAAFAPDTFTAMVLVNGVGLFSLGMGIVELSLALGRDAGTAWRAAWTAPLGMGVFFWILFPIRAAQSFLGASRDPAGLWSKLSLARVDIATTRTYLADFGSHPFFLNKYLVGTAYGLALAFLVCYLAAISRWMSERKVSQLSAASLWLLALLLLHPLAGVCVVLISGFCAVAMLALRRLREACPPRALLQWMVALGIAGVIALPYLRAISGTRTGAQVLPLGFTPRVVLALVAGALWGILFGAPWIKRLWREASLPGRFYVLWIAGTWIIALFIRLPGPNSADKFGFLTYLPLGILAAWWTAEHWRGLRGALLLLLVLGPANLIGYAGYFGDRDPRTIDPLRDEAYDWLRRETPSDAIVVEQTERLELAVLLPRRIYFGREIYGGQFGYPVDEMAERLATVTHLFDPTKGLDLERTHRTFARLGHPTFVFLRLAEAGDREAARRLAERPDLFLPRWSNSSFEVFESR